MKMEKMEKMKKKKMKKKKMKKKKILLFFLLKMVKIPERLDQTAQIVRKGIVISLKSCRRFLRHIF